MYLEMLLRPEDFIQSCPQDLIVCVFCFRYRYGTLVFIDAMYRTSMYDLALFLLVVRTNVSFSLGAAFIIQHEEQTAVARAIQQIKDNMEKEGFQWDPAYWMADKSWAEFHGVRSVFPGLLCLS